MDLCGYLWFSVSFEALKINQTSASRVAMLDAPNPIQAVKLGLDIAWVGEIQVLLVPQRLFEYSLY
jgi:hypothetical protein